ncbi:ABC transporter substrate-binding protein [Mesorhizobium sp. BAC0120]|uniref:ABC transporter substrate-binding protein n=1 Tax=Mesorhizobium sp. BAC0120 TaxID=3090670 RepID=UPI00298C48F7|nr:ABC transporter substrate-binding protein [Mesorhizobium sp. BAC0120]MDW6023383.1 ABC transporter substrate-binding protein [Mesorhizobium sp. BAC0120]
MNRRDFLASMAALTASTTLPAKWAIAQSRADSLRVLSEGAANSFDTISIGVNRNSIQVTWNVYDRLVTFAYKPREDGTPYYDYFDIQGELAESYEVAENKKSITFHLRKDAVFHDGSPVTAEDVKWSLDRVVASPVGKAQFQTGSMTDPNQFVVVDAHTIRVDLPQPDRFALPNLALTYPIIVNSKLAKQHATESDPFAMEWLKNNAAGGGAFKIEKAAMGERIIFARFDEWKGGALPKIKRVLWQTVPAAESRIASLVRKDADIVQDIPPKDVVALLKNPDVKVIGVPTSSFQFIGMNGDIAPFNDVRVRQAIAYALPYDNMFKAALFGRGQPLFGGQPGEPSTTKFPQPLGYSTDIEKAKALLTEAGLADGFSTTFSYELSVATIAEPIALLLQESLGKIGIKIEIQKVPAGQLGTLLQEKKVPFYFEGSTSYLADPDYFFRIFYYGDTRWNFGSYKNPEFAKLVEKTRYETDSATYDADIKRMITLVKQDIPIILLWHPALDTGMQKDVEGYSYAFHRQLELKTLSRA